MDYPSHSSSGTENDVTREITRSEEEEAVSEGLEIVVMEDAIKVERGEDEDDFLKLVSETQPSEGDEDRDGQFVKTSGDNVVKDEAEDDGYSWKRDNYDKIDRMLDAIPDTSDSYTIECPMKDNKQKTENEAMTSTEVQPSEESDDDCVFVSETRPVEEDEDDCLTLVSETKVQPSAESDDDCVFVSETRPVEEDEDDCLTLVNEIEVQLSAESDDDCVFVCDTRPIEKDEDDCLTLVSETRPSEGDEDRDGQFVKTSGDNVVKDEAEDDGYSWKSDNYDKIDRMLDASPDTSDSYTIEWPMKDDRQKTENEAMTSTEVHPSAESDDDCVFVCETRAVEEDEDDCLTLVSEIEVQPSSESDDDCVFVCDTRPIDKNEDDCLTLVSESRPSEGDEDRDGQFVKTSGDNVVKDEAEDDGYSWKRDNYGKIDRMLDASPDTSDSYTIEWPMIDDRQKTENEAMTSTEFQPSAESDDDCVFVSETRPVEEDEDDCLTLVSETEVHPSAESDDDCVFVCETRAVEKDEDDCKLCESETRTPKRKREDSDDREFKRTLAAMPGHSGFLNHSTLKRKREASADCNHQAKRTLAAEQVPRVYDRCARPSQFSTAAATAVSEVRVACKERDLLGRGYQKAVCRTETTDEDDRQKAYDEELFRAVTSIEVVQPPAESDDEFSETPEESDDENRKTAAVGRCVWSPQQPSTAAAATVPDIRDVRQKPVDEETRRAVALIGQLLPSAKVDDDSTSMSIQFLSDTTRASSEKLGESAVDRPYLWSLSQPSVAATTVPDIRGQADERDRSATLNQKALGRGHNATIMGRFSPAEQQLQAVSHKFKAIPPTLRTVVGRGEGGNSSRNKDLFVERPRSYVPEVKTEASVAMVPKSNHRGDDEDGAVKLKLSADNDGATEIPASTGTHAPVLRANVDEAPVSRLHGDDNRMTRDQDLAINSDRSSDGL